MLINTARAIAIMVTISASMIAATAHAADVAEGKVKSAICAACHGKDGNSSNPLWPKLAGQHAAYLAKQMRAFRAGERLDPIMGPMMVGSSDEDIENLAAYYSSLKQK